MEGDTEGVMEKTFNGNVGGGKMTEMGSLVSIKKGKHMRMRGVNFLDSRGYMM